MHVGKPMALALLILVSVGLAESIDKVAFDAAFQDGKAAFERQDYPHAYTKLVQAFRENPGHADVNFLLGRTAFELGDYESAVMAFERVLIMQPALQRAKLELARSYFRLGVHEMAKVYFQEVLDTGPPEPVKRNIEAFLQRIEEQAEKARKRHVFSGVLTLAGHYDTNVRVAPSSSTVQTATQAYELDPDSRKEGDLLFSATLALNHQYRLGESRYSWKSSAVAYHSAYKDESDLNILYASLASGIGLDQEKYVVDAQGIIEYLDKESDRYLWAYGAQINVVRALSRTVFLALGTRLVDKTYWQAPKRDALNVSLSGGPIVVWGPNRLTTRIGFEHEDASAGEAGWEEDEQSYDKVLFGVRYDRRLPARFTCFTSYKYQYTDYDARYAAFNRDRLDRIHEVSAGIGRTLTTSTSIELSHTFTDARSSIELYQYDRHVTTLSVTARF